MRGIWRQRGQYQRREALGRRGKNWTGAALLSALLGSALGSLALGSAAVLAQTPPVQTPPTRLAQVPSQRALLLNQLDEAVCSNRWDDAIELTGGLLALSNISADYRLALLGFRDELVELQAFNAIIPNGSSCDRANALTLTAPVAARATTPPRLDWRQGLAALSGRNRQIIQLDPTPNELVNPPIPLALLNDAPFALSDALSMDTRDGFSVVAGAVTPNRQQTYAFVARIGDRVTLDLDVTRIAVDAGITGEDSHLFLFDRTGRLISENDDADGRQSRIDSVVVVDTQVYYVVVTSHNNLPILNTDEQLVGWTGTGSTQFDYTLTLTGATPSGEILR